MFDFWKEVIINTGRLPITDGHMPNSTVGWPRFYAKTNVATPMFRVLRCADYKTENISNLTMTPGTYGTPAEGSLSLLDLGDGGQFRIKIELGLKQRYDSDYANAWSDFKKTFIVDYNDAYSNGLPDVDKINDLIKLAEPANYNIRCQASSGQASTSQYAVINVTCLDNHMTIKSMVLEQLVPDECSDGCSNMNYVVVREGNITDSELPFATGEWLIENLRFPSYPNLRHAAVNSEEMPIPGKLYTQFTFDYCVPRRGYTGQGAVGQQVDSITHHVFYVLNEIDPSVDETLTLAELFLETLGTAGVETARPFAVNKIELYYNNDAVDTIRIAKDSIDAEGGIVIEANLVGVDAVPTWILSDQPDWTVVPAVDGKSAQLVMPNAEVGMTAALTVAAGLVRKTVDIEII